MHRHSISTAKSHGSKSQNEIIPGTSQPHHVTRHVAWWMKHADGRPYMTTSLRLLCLSSQLRVTGILTGILQG